MAEVLKMPQLVDQHGMPEMKIRRRGIEARLDAKGTS